MIHMQHKTLCLASSALFSIFPIIVGAQSSVPAALITKEQLMTAPAGARHYTISSLAGKYGDIWSWSMPNGRIAYPMSMNLRGWITEEDEQVTLGPDSRVTAIAVRGYNDSGDATENFNVDATGAAHWKTIVDSGTAAFGNKLYNTYGGPWLESEIEVRALIAAGDKGVDLLPTGHASITVGPVQQIDGQKGTKTLKLAFVRGLDFSPSPMWLDKDNRFFGMAGDMALLPEGYETYNPKLEVIQDKAIADMVRDVAHQFLTPANRIPTLIDHVLLFDSLGGQYLADRAVLIDKGKVAASGPAGSIPAPTGATVVDGRGKTLLPGLWDSHQHVGGADWNLLQNVSTGITNYRSPGTQIDDALSIYKRRAAGDLLAPDGKISVIIDQKGPLAAQGGLTVTSAAEAVAAVDKNAAIVEMSAIVIALMYGFFFVHSFHDVIAMGVLLGLAGASFGVALSLGSGWFPQEYKGLAMGIAGAGNSGTALAALFAPRLAMHFGWQHVYGFAALMMLLPLCIMIFFAKEPPDVEHQSLAGHLKCLTEKDGWYFNLVYIITFGGFIGLATFLPTFYVSQFHMTKVQAGTYTVFATLTGSATRVLGGWFADRIGGITTLSVVFLIAIGGLFGLTSTPSLAVTTGFFMLCFAALGAGNGATFQMVPLRWPITTAVAGGMIGEIGALGGSILPLALSQSKQHTGSYATGFMAYAGLAVCILLMLRLVSRSWTRTWVGPGGRALMSRPILVDNPVATGEGLVVPG